MQDKCYTPRCECGKGKGYDRNDECCEKRHHSCCEDECCEKKHHDCCNEDCCDCSSKPECHECGTNFKEAVCIHTDKIFDSCRDKDYASYILYYN